MPYSSINKPSLHMNTVLYAGNSTTTNAISGVGFQPDWTWIKGRNYAGGHRIYDAVRGADQVLSSSTTAAQNGTIPLTSFDSDGFTIGSSDDSVNGAYNYVSWNWLAGNTSGSSNTDGSITSTVTANTTAGFSIVKYTGTGSAGTVGHGLGVTPAMIIARPYTSVQYWSVYHQSYGADYYGYLNGTHAFSNTPSNVWNSTMTSSTFGVGSGVATNESSQTHIAYCFAEVKSYSKFGSYTGNGSTDAPFIYTGFRPAFVMIKLSSGIDNWFMLDNKRSTSGGNVIDDYLYANLSNAEGGTNILDFTSNGFKIRTTDTGYNGSGSTYIYMAFAEQTLVGTNNVCATAR